MTDQRIRRLDSHGRKRLAMVRPPAPAPARMDHYYERDRGSTARVPKEPSMKQLFLALCALAVFAAVLPADPPGKRTPREALQPFGDLVGTWKGTGVPKGKNSKDGFWVEQLAWQWQFKKDDAWLKVTFEKGK